MSTVLVNSDLPLTWPESGLKPHRYATTFRMLVGEEKAALDASVTVKGVLNRIRIFENAILDGRNRYLSAVDVGLFNPQGESWQDRPELFEEFVGTPAEALDLVWSLNEERRHDSAGERAMAAARRKVFLDELAENDPAIGKKTDAELAREHGVSERLINSANKVVERAAPEVQAAVETGAMSVTDAADVADLSPIEQRIIVENPDRKAIKQKVKAAKAPKPAPLFEAPRIAPLPMMKFAQFAQSVLNVARGGKGASVDAGTIVAFAAQVGIVAEEGDGFVFTPEALAAMGTLAAAERQAPNEVRSPIPLPPSVGGPTMEFTVGGLRDKAKAHFAIRRPAESEFYVSTSFEFPNRGGAHGGIGPWRDMATALAAAAGELMSEFEAVAQSTDSVTTDKEKAAARGGLKWFGDKLAGWGITAMPIQQIMAARTPDPEVPDAAAVYERLIATQGEMQGRHTRETAEPIIRAADAARVPLIDVAKALGHPKGTIGGWRNKLGLQRPDGNPNHAGHA